MTNGRNRNHQHSSRELRLRNRCALQSPKNKMRLMASHQSFSTCEPPIRLPAPNAVEFQTSGATAAEKIAHVPCCPGEENFW